MRLLETVRMMKNVSPNLWTGQTISFEIFSPPEKEGLTEMFGNVNPRIYFKSIFNLFIYLSSSILYENYNWSFHTAHFDFCSPTSQGDKLLFLPLGCC